MHRNLTHECAREVSVCVCHPILFVVFLQSMVFTPMGHILSLFLHNACKSHPESGEMVIGLEF